MTATRLIKTPEEIAAVKEGGLLLSSILGELVAMVRPGITTGELDAHAQRRMKEVGGEPSFLGYRIDRVTVPFNSAVCLSINEEVVHAPATPSREVKSGDLLKLDIGLRYKGMCTDMAVTVPVGDVAPALRTLANVTKESLLAGIGKIRPGAWISDIGKAVDKVVRRAGFSTVKDLCGHGVGHRVHEDPPIPNYFDPGLEPVRIEPGMVLAIEPMVNLGREEVKMLRDGWTVVAKDKKHSAHFEVTVVVTEDGMEVATPLPRMILLGVDYGTVRIGLAVLDTEVGFALPLRSVDGKAGEREAAAEVARIAKEERADRIVVGVPTLMSGGEGQMADAARAFAAALAAAGASVDTEDERMTTALALKSMADAGFKKGSLDKDAAAAALILESYWARTNK